MRKIFCIVFTLYYLHAFAQHMAFPYSNHKFAVSYTKHNGYVVLNNGIRIQGTFEYAADEFPTYNLKSFSNDSKVMNRYKNKDLQIIVLAGSDKDISHKDSTYFFVFKDSPKFWRQLSFNKDIQV